MYCFKLKLLILLFGSAFLLSGCGKNDQHDPPLAPGVVPTTLSDTLQVKRGSKVYVISGIGISGSNTVAIINNEVVIPGVELDPGTVLQSIHPTYVNIRIDQRNYMIRPESIQKELDNKEVP